MSETKSKSKLFKAITQIQPIVKDKTNPHFKNKYADINGMLEDVKPVLHQNGLFLLQPIVNGFVCSQIFDGDSGEIVAESSLRLTDGLNAQQKGSEITYFRRYTLQSLLGLEAEDEDGNIASQPKAPTPATPEPEKWLNDVDKDGNPTKEWHRVVLGVNDGKITSVNDVRKYFKVSKAVADKIEALLRDK